MVQITFSKGTNEPTITLSAGDYHQDIDPNTFRWQDGLLSILDLVLRGSGPLDVRKHEMQINGLLAASRDGFSLTAYAQALDDTLEVELQALKEQYEQGKETAEIIITDPVALEEHLQELRDNYERSVKNTIVLADANLQGAYLANVVEHLNADNYDPTEQCFTAETQVQMWPLDQSVEPRLDGSYDEQLVLAKVWYKRQDQMQTGDLVVSYDKHGRLQPGRVTRTMTNIATHILDFWGTGVTPGHAYQCADGPLKGSFAPIMDILRMDGALMRSDGAMFRSTTNCEVGSMGDRMIHAVAGMKKSDAFWTEKKLGQIRFGTHISTPDGKKSFSVMEIAERQGWSVTDDGYMLGKFKGRDGTVREEKFPFPYTFGTELPKPEDYILTRSQLTLEEIYLASDWEQIGTRMPAPASMAGLDAKSSMTRTQSTPNIPPAFADRPDAPVAQRVTYASATPSPSVANRDS